MNEDGKFPNHERPAFVERRRKTDWVTYMASILSFISWLVAFAVLIVLDQAQPEKDNIFTTWFGVEVRKVWDTSLLPIAFLVLVVSLCFCIFAFIFNILWKKRKTDKYKKSIIISGAVTLVGIIFFVVRFGLPALPWG